MQTCVERHDEPAGGGVADGEGAGVADAPLVDEANVVQAEGNVGGDGDLEAVMIGWQSVGDGLRLLGLGIDFGSSGREELGLDTGMAEDELFGFFEVPAGEDFCVEFTNNDTVVHDFGIVETEFNGDDVEPGESITYLVPAIEAGDYTFYCTLHPTQMVGDLIVGE